MTLYVWEDDQPYYAVLIDTPAGVIVKLCCALLPKGQRVLDEMTFDAPLHHVADRVHALLNR